MDQSINPRKDLTPEQRHILLEKGTEAPFTGKYWNNKETGMYHCASCGAQLFSSNTKFDSGTGWPSFISPTEVSAVILKDDSSLGMHRTEVLCARCGGHLGHVFEDGPKELASGCKGDGKRFCINSLSLDFTPTQNS